MLQTTFSCVTKPVTIKEPLTIYVINQSAYEARVGLKNFNIRLEPKTLGEWISDERVFLPLSDIPNQLACYSTEDWLTVVKPTLKKGAQQFKDSQD